MLPVPPFPARVAAEPLRPLPLRGDHRLAALLALLLGTSVNHGLHGADGKPGFPRDLGIAHAQGPHPLDFDVRLAHIHHLRE